MFNTEDTFDFLESQLPLPKSSLSSNLVKYSMTKIEDLMLKEKHYDLNDIQLRTILKAPPHLLEITKEYVLSLNRALFQFDYVDNTENSNSKIPIKIRMHYIDRSKLTSIVHTVGLLKISQQHLQKHIDYLREHDALYNSMFMAAMPRKLHPWDISDYFKFSHLENEFHRFPLIDSLVHHKVPSSIVYFKS